MRGDSYELSSISHHRATTADVDLGMRVDSLDNHSPCGLDEGIEADEDHSLLQREGKERPLESRSILLRYDLAFFLFGTLNNVLYVIVLTAALDLVPPSVPKGVVLLVNIAPSLTVKVAWPYLLSGRVRYAKRVIGCSAVSFAGMMVVAFFPSIALRLMGIALASFSSGLGEMTFLQLSTSYGDDALGTRAVGWFASGTGAAGFVGAGMWWLLRGLGVQAGLGISSVLPLCMALSFLALLPRGSTMKCLAGPSAATYTPLASSVHTAIGEEGAAVGAESDIAIVQKSVSVGFTWAEKKELARPLVVKYMVPLFTVYLAEYTINTGVAPGLVYSVPSETTYPIFSHFIKSLRDYYPLWQLTYQTFVFFSRSSISIFRLPPLPSHLLPLPCLLQLVILGLTLTESSFGFLTLLFGRSWILVAVWALVACEGICGGTAYVAAYHWLGIEEGDEEPDDGAEAVERKVAKREFRIACVGFADTMG